LALYQSLGQANRGIDESAAYNGFKLGNDIITGCLTNDICAARIHLCVPPCLIATRANTVYIRPFLGRGENGFEMRDMGTGGGSGDVYMRHELEFPPEEGVMDLVARCHERMIFYSEQQRANLEWRLRNDFENNGGRLPISKYGVFLEDYTTFDDLADLLVINLLKYDQNMAVENRANVSGNPRRTVIVSSSLSCTNRDMTITKTSDSDSRTHGIPHTLSCVISLASSSPRIFVPAW
jgi:hypothetical protein